MLIVFVLLILYNTNGAFCKNIHHDEICGGFDGRRLYFELGEHGTLLASKSNGNYSDAVVNESKHCSLEIVTCPSCVVSIQFSFLNITSTCSQNLSTNSIKCECDYVWIYESPYENVSGKRFCGTFIESKNDSLIYKSKTRSVTIKFVYTKYHEQAFLLKYFSERNRHFINSYPKRNREDMVEKYLTSPFFPIAYPKDLSVEYVLNCRTIEICKIKLVFSDFQISRSSLIEFFDWNGQRMFVTTGSLFRPPILTSTGPTMVIRFYANGGTNTGFKLTYSYLLGNRNNSTAKTNTDCGGLVDNLGGAITMMEMTEDEDKIYNCFWLIKPPQGYMHLKTHIYAKVTKFEDFAGSTQLLLREGLTSEGYLLVNMTYPSNLKIKEHVVSINEGIYMSLTGTFDTNSKLEIVYSAFSYRDCVVGSDFLCQNERCISTTLQCDGFDNCGDLSDEPEVCATNKRKTFAHIPNFYFPKSDRDFDLKTATIVFIISSLALICLIISLIVLLYRINMKGNTTRHLQTHLQTINDLLEESTRVEEVEIIISDDPPNYEAPPDYADVIKTLDVNSIKRRKHNKKIIVKQANRLLPTINDDLDNTSLSTTGSTTNLLPGSSSSAGIESSPLPIPANAANRNDISNSEVDGVLVPHPGLSNVEGGVTRAESEISPKWSEKNLKFEFNPINLNNSNRIGFFSYLRATNRHHCLSDSDLSSVMSFSEDAIQSKQSRIVRSVSTEKIN